MHTELKQKAASLWTVQLTEWTDKVPNLLFHKCFVTTEILLVLPTIICSSQSSLLFVHNFGRINNLIIITGGLIIT